MTIDPTVFDDAFTSLADEHHIPSIAWAVVRDGAIATSGATGTLPDGTTPTVDTAYRIASMTKSFTAAAILELRDEGVLEIDQPVADWYPAASSIGSTGPTLTIADLLTMRSGLPTDDPYGDRCESLPLTALDRQVAAGLTFAWPNRTRYEYSNIGYAILGRVIEAAAGQTYQQFVRERLLEPLRLDSSGFRADAYAPGRLAPGHVLRDGQPVLVPAVLPGAYSPMGGLHSTLTDLAAWTTHLMRAWQQDSPLDAYTRASLLEMQTAHQHEWIFTRAAGTDRAQAVSCSYGYGVHVEHAEQLGTVIQHSGGYPGYGSHMRMHPATRTAIIALGNLTYAPVSNPAVDLLAAITENPTPCVPAHPATLAAMNAAESALDSAGLAPVDHLLAGNVLLDTPAAARAADLVAVRAAIGPFTRDVASVTHKSPLQATWTVTGPGGTAELEILLTPQSPPLVQRLRVRTLPT